MPAGDDTFDREVATRLARVANRYPERLPYLVDYCRRHVEASAEQLIQVAQEGEGALGRALTLLWQERPFHDINERLFPLLPERTVQLRDFTVELVKQMISSGRKSQHTLNQSELRSILTGRLREAGRFDEALAEARKLAEDPGLATEPPELQAVVWGNLGVCYADGGEWTPSYEAHRQAVRFYQTLPVEKLQQIANLVANECVNVAVAAMKLELWDEAEAWSDQGLKLSGRLRASGLLLRAQLVRVVFLSETSQLDKALELGKTILENALDWVEIDQQSYSPLLLDVYINLGSILLDLHRSEEAAPYFEAANIIASKLHRQAPSVASRNKLVIATISVAQIQIARGDRQGLDHARAALSQARALYEEAGNDYQREILMRAVEVNVTASVEFSDSNPDVELVNELVGFSSPRSASPGHEESSALQRRLHLGGMAFSKLGMKDRALWCAQEAVRLADISGQSATPEQSAQRAVLYDGLSRRLEELNRLLEAVEKAEAACRILLPIFSLSQDTYQEWMYSFMEHFRGLTIKLDKFEDFKDFFTTEFEPKLGRAGTK